MDEDEAQKAERRAVDRGWLLLAAKLHWGNVRAARRRGRRLGAWMAAHLSRRKS